MRVLIVHNRYRSAFPSGENTVVDEDVARLREAGVTVDTYLRDSDEIEGYGAVDRIALAGRPLISPRSCRDLDAQLRSARPDVVHLHNPYPLVSPAVVHVAHRHQVPVVQSVHNYRHVCAAGTFFRDGQVCQDCTGRRIGTPAIEHACYRGSRVQSAIMVAAIGAHAATWRRVDRLLPVSPFVGTWLADVGFDPSRITVHPNAVADPGAPLPLGRGFAFLGRLDEAKGIRLLAEAWTRSGLDGVAPLVIAGDGELRPLVEELASRSTSVTYLGPISPARAREVMAGAAAVVVPSQWFEALPLTILEAFSHGRPVVTTALGSMPSIVDERTGYLCQPSARALASTLASVHLADLTDRSVAARREYLLRYTPQSRVERALEIYQAVAAERDVRSAVPRATVADASASPILDPTARIVNARTTIQ